jgi:hypothetical protein
MKSYFGAAGEPPGDEDGQPHGGGVDAGSEVLPYRVEVWDDAGGSVEHVVALLRNRSVGWAAFYAATEQYPDRVVIYRDQFSELARWDKPRSRH